MPRAPRRSSRCSRASARRASASSSRKRARTRRRSSSSTSSTPWAPRARATASTASRTRRSTSCSSSSTGSTPPSASNRLQDLDPALLRPGRFDRQMLVSPPDLGGREAILNVHTRGKPLAADVDLHLVAKQTAGLTGADLSNICSEAAIFAGRKKLQYLRHAEFDAAMERVVAGLQQRRVVSEKEKRILAYHEAGHAVVSHLTGDFLPVQKVTIVARGQALGYTLNLPAEDRYLHTKEELVDLMKVYLGGRRVIKDVFGRVTNGAANDLEKVTGLARAMVFEYGMSEVGTSRTMRADNYALSEETKRLRDSEQA